MPEEPPTEEELRQRRQLRAFATWAKTTAETRRSDAATNLDRWRQRSAIVDAAALVYERDRSVAASVLGSAVAFRLFLFFVPTMLFAVGLAGFVGRYANGRQVSESTNITGALADQISAALSQPGSTRWIATLAGLVGMLTAGRTLTKVMQASSALAWHAPLRRKVGVRVIVSVVGILVALTLMAALVNRARAVGVAVAGLSLLGAMVVYAVGWLLMTHALPRTTTDPGAGIPGAVLVGVAIAGLEAVSQLYLPNQIGGASRLYGSVGAAIATLGWFFILGRVMVLALVVDAVVYERFGSLSQFVFGLPVIRALPRRFPSVRRFFDLDGHHGDAPV